MFRGLTRGLQLIADWFSMWQRATVAQNDQCVSALGAVAATWFREATGFAIGTKNASLKVNVGTFIFGGDPFSGSRQQFETVRQNFPGV